jgi:pilus assembly protein CpaF
MDWQLVRRLKSAAADRIEGLEQDYTARHDRRPSQEDRRELGKPVIQAVVADHARSSAAEGDLWSPAMEDAAFKAVFDSIYGYGRLQPLFELQDVRTVTVHGTARVRVHYTDGRIGRLPPVADSNEELMDQLRQLAQNAVPRRAFDAQNLDMTLEIGEQFRLHAVADEIMVAPRVSIRYHNLTRVGLGDLVDLGVLPTEVGELLYRCVLARLCIAFAGEQNAGKTTDLRAAVDAIPLQEEFGTIETDLELFSHRMPGRDTVAVFHARSGMGDVTAGARAGEVPVSAMVKMALRQTLTRIILGEMRTPDEALALFEAMQVGAGTMFTVHSSDAPGADAAMRGRATAARLTNLIAQAGTVPHQAASRMIGQFLNLIVYCAQIDNRPYGGTVCFRVTDIVWCSPGDDGEPVFSQVYTTDAAGSPVSFTPPTELLNRLERYPCPGLPRHLSPGEAA